MARTVSWTLAILKRCRIGITVLTMALMLYCTRSQAQQLVFVVNASGALYQVDMGTCASTLIGYTGAGFFDIAYCQTSGTLYGVTEDEELYIIDQTDASITFVGYTGLILNALVCDDLGVLYGACEFDDNIYSVNTTSGLASTLGSTGTGSVSGGDLTYFNGSMYWSTASDDLVLVDLANLSNSTIVGSIGGVNDVYGIVSVLGCTQEVYVSSGSGFYLLNMTTLGTSSQCPFAVPGAIYGAASATETVIGPSIQPAGPFCSTDAPTLIQASASGGVWSATCGGCINGATGLFDPYLAGPGVWTITYTYCGQDLSINVLVQSNTGIISPIGPLCSLDGLVVLVASIGGGTWSGNGIIDPAVGTFDPTVAGAGTHLISYLTNGPCSSTTTTTIEVFDSLGIVLPSTGPFCEDEPSVVLAAPLPGGIWNGAGVIDAAGGILDPSMAGPGLHVLSYVLDTGSCPSYGTTTVTVLAQPHLSPAPFGPFCINGSTLSDPLILADLPGTGSFNHPPGWDIPIALGAGLHTITYSFIATNGCADSVSVPFIINDTSAVAFDSMHLCIDSPPLDLDLLVDLPGDTFLTDYGNGWVILPDVFDPPLVTPAPTIATSVPLVYQYTNVLGCTSSNDTVITVHPPPQLIISSQDGCEYDSLEILNSSSIASGSVASWLWEIGGQGTSNSQQVGPYLVNADTITIGLTATSDRGCVATAMDTVLVHPAPNAAFILAGHCQLDTFNYTNATTISWPEPFASDWRFGDGATAGTASTNHIWVNWGTFMDTLIVTSGFGCRDTISQAITIHPAPVNSMVLTPNCHEDSTTVVSTSTIPLGSIDSTWWNMEVNAYTGSSATHLFSSAGFWPVTLHTLSDQGCGTVLTDTIEIWPLPEVAYILDQDVLCMNDNVLFTDASSIPAPYTNVAWTWLINGAQHGTGPGMTVLFTDSGSYDVGLVVTSGNGCIDSLFSDAQITVNPLPIAGFFADPAQTGILQPEIQFMDSSMAAAEWDYDLGDGDYSSAQNPLHEYATFGTYMIQQIVTNAFGCLDTAWQEVVIDPDLLIYVPNAFTPDGDGMNDVFLPSLDGFDVHEYNLTIWDRWGALLFETGNQAEAWDGRVNGDLVQEGVYVWQMDLQAADFVGNERRRGHVTVVR